MPLTQTKVNVVKNTTEGCGCIYRDWKLISLLQQSQCHWKWRWWHANFLVKLLVKVKELFKIGFKTFTKVILLEHQP